MKPFARYTYSALCVLVLLASCSTKQFGFRKTVPVKDEETVVATMAPLGKMLNSGSKTGVPSAEDSEVKTPLTGPVNLRSEAMLVITPQPNQLQNDTTKRKKYSFDAEKDDPPSESAKNDSSKRKNRQSLSTSDNLAIVGFSLALGGFLTYGLTTLPGIIVSVFGLKSERYRGLAIAGIILGFIIVALVILLIMAYARAMSSY